MILRGVILTVLIFFTLSAISDEVPLGPRVLFDEDFFWVTKEGADKLVETAKASGFNIIVPCVWHGRGASWDSSIIGKDAKLKEVDLKRHDALSYLISIAHKNDIEVHPWFTVFLRQADIYPKFTDPSIGAMFNIHDREFHQIINQVIMDVVRNYDIDGVNLDYIRSKKVCDSAACADDYEKRYSRSLHADILTKSVNPAARRNIERWQKQAVIDAVRLISGSVRSYNPDLIISVDTLVNDVLWGEFGADAVTWLNEGLVDIAYHMDYTKTLNKPFIKKAYQQLEEPWRMIVLMGNFKFEGETSVARSDELVAKLYREALELSPNGSVGMYEYRFVTPGQINDFSRVNLPLK
ncbi:glycosyl hydrolase family 10 [Sinobacterium caligoides]|uniref:Glycosyl hydrolase family 10 n=2 Tax=Sinobacterium caligoides TaxID=933926 RepID=A0A3N2E021_9GAMM|nr:glycosyl hydrolase family 10 [Sinobacterium caligoides]